jgi:hypothetical protein
LQIHAFGGQRTARPTRLIPFVCHLDNPDYLWAENMKTPPMGFSAVRRGIFVAKTIKKNPSSVGATS